MSALGVAMPRTLRSWKLPAIAIGRQCARQRSLRVQVRGEGWGWWRDVDAHLMLNYAGEEMEVVRWWPPAMALAANRARRCAARGAAAGLAQKGREGADKKRAGEDVDEGLQRTRGNFFWPCLDLGS